MEPGSPRARAAACSAGPTNRAQSRSRRLMPSRGAPPGIACSRVISWPSAPEPEPVAVTTTPTAMTARMRPVPGAISSPKRTARTAAIAPSVEAIVTMTATAPIRYATYVSSKPETLPRPAARNQAHVPLPKLGDGAVASATGSVTARPIVIAQATVDSAPISRLARAEVRTDTVNSSAAPRPPRMGTIQPSVRDARALSLGGPRRRLVAGR